MWKPRFVTSAIQTRRLLLPLFSSSSSLTSLSSSYSSSLGHDVCCLPLFSRSSALFNSSGINFRSYGSIQDPKQSGENSSNIATEISKEILREESNDGGKESLTLDARLDAYFPHIHASSSLLLQVLNCSYDAGRKVLDFYKWFSKKSDFRADDESYSYLVDFFGRRKDFKAVEGLLIDGRGVTGRKTLTSVIHRLIRAGRHTQAISYFEKMDKDYGLVRDRESLFILVSALCEHGYAGHAEKIVRNLADEFFPDETICDLLVKGWCADEKLDEARRLMGEISRGGFELGTSSYNSLLDCVCRLCRKKEPMRLPSEAEKILLEMDLAGIPRNTETFNVLISNLCKIRKTEDALHLFRRMGEWQCEPNSTTFSTLVKSLYLAARVEEGDEMLDAMKSAGFGADIDKKMYYGFIKTLCGIERIEHAMKVFSMMKRDGCSPGIKTFDLLMKKLCSHSQVDRANKLFREAFKKGLPVTLKLYRVDDKYLKKPKSKEKEKPKRETLPMKMARKRRRLRKLRLSFVKKSKPAMRRAF